MMLDIKQDIDDHRKVLEKALGGNLIMGPFSKEARKAALKVVKYTTNLLDNATIEAEAQSSLFYGALTSGEVEQVHLEIGAYDLHERLSVISEAWRLLEDARHVLKQSGETVV